MHLGFWTFGIVYSFDYVVSRKVIWSLKYLEVSRAVVQKSALQLMKRFLEAARIFDSVDHNEVSWFGEVAGNHGVALAVFWYLLV